MGLFDSFFGPSWAERVAQYMEERRLPVPERMRLCIKNLSASLSPSEAAQGLPLSEIKKYLAVLENHDEMLQLAVAMHTRKSLRVTVVILKKKSEAKWQMAMVGQAFTLPVDDEVRYRKFENEHMAIWNPVDNYGNDLAPAPR